VHAAMNISAANDSTTDNTVTTNTNSAGDSSHATHIPTILHIQK